MKPMSKKLKALLRRKLNEAESRRLARLESESTSPSEKNAKDNHEKDV